MVAVLAQGASAVVAQLKNVRLHYGKTEALRGLTLDIPAGGKVIFAPGQYHLMLFGLKKPLTDGEWCAEDCWLRANVRSIETMVRQFRGELSPREGLSQGLFSAAKALPIDQLIQRAWQ